MNRTGTTTRDRTRKAPERRAAKPAPVLQLRRPARMSPRRRRALRVSVTVLLLLTAAWVLWASPLLAVRSVEVDGAGARLSAQIREAAAVVTGTPLLRVDVDAAEARVAQLPAVASVDVSRGWPGSVVITVAERIPVAVVEHDGRRTLLDAEGVLFDTITGEPPEGVLPIAVPEPGPGDPATATVLAALAALPEEVRDRVALLSATSGEDATLTLLDGTTVVWGSGSQARSKASVLTALLEQLDDGTLEPAGTIDVSTPDAVVLR